MHYVCLPILKEAVFAMLFIGTVETFADIHEKSLTENEEKL
jgi:hypothetical protein